MISITDPQEYRLAEVTAVHVSGLKAIGSFVLVCRLEMSIGKVSTETRLRDLSIRLELAGREVSGLIGYGVSDGRPEIRWFDHSSHEQVIFLIQLSPYQVEAIESIRRGGDIQLSVWLYGEVQQDDKVAAIREQSEYRIPQQEWVQALGQMNYRNVLLFELPLPPAGDEIDPLADLLFKAQEHLFAGHYDESVACCRQAIECVENNDSNRRLAASAVEKYKNNRTEMDVGERIIFLREALKNITHTASHYNQGEGFSYNQARMVLGATVAMLSHATVASVS